MRDQLKSGLAFGIQLAQFAVAAALVIPGLVVDEVKDIRDGVLERMA